MIQARQVNEFVALVRAVAVMNSLLDMRWQPWLSFDVFVKLPSISNPVPVIVSYYCCKDAGGPETQ